MDEKKIVILNTAKKIVNGEGFESITIRRIAKEAGISVGSVYNIVGSKDEIYYLLIEDYWANALEKILSDSLYPNDNFIKNLEILYKNFKKENDSFHKSWIKGLVGINMKNKDIQELTLFYKNKIQDKLEELMLKDKLIKKSFKEDKMGHLSNFVFENTLTLLRDDKYDMNFFKFILNELLY